MNDSVCRGLSAESGTTVLSSKVLLLGDAVFVLIQFLLYAYFLSNDS